MSDIEQKDTTSSTPVLEAKGYQNAALFKGNDGLLFAFKKSQKLAAAVYLVTDLVSEGEQLRSDLRSLSVGLVKDILSNTARRGASLSTRLLEIISLLEIASGARLISPMNAEVLKREYENVLEAINKMEGGVSAPPISLTPEILGAERFPENFSSSVPSPLSISPAAERNYLSEAPQTIVPRRAPHIGQTKGQDTSVTKERSLSILDLIKKSPQALSIKDISGHIRNVGEKTIQRELSALVAQGVLKREGERRWSRYSLR